MVDIEYKWKRFWYPRGLPYSFSEDGFSGDPDRWKMYMRTPLASIVSLMSNPCLVLLGEPGIGKTFAVKRSMPSIKEKVQQQGDATFMLDLNEYGSEDRLVRELFENQTIKSWINGSHKLHLFLDSFDECLLEIKTLGLILLNKLKSYPIERLYLRLVCRSADWQSNIEEGLKRIWGKDAFSVYELAPLRKVDVIEAAKMNVPDAISFMNEILSTRVVPLARKPITLQFLLNLYSRKNCFPDTQEELYLKGCELLCEEPATARRETGRCSQYSSEQKLKVASRIAAVSIFANRSSVWTDIDMGDVSAEDLTVKDITGGKEKTNGESVEVNKSVIEETLKTGLFKLRSPNRIGWSHQTFAEYLAAYYLKNHNLSFKQITELITHPGETGIKIVPSLQETAAWLASMIPEIFEKIIKHDPVVLLRSDVANSDFKARAVLVENLLHQYDKKTLMDNSYISPNYTKLEHPDLAGQLRKYISDNSKNIDARIVAINIAEACKVQSLADDFIEIIYDNNQPQRIRVKAAYAIYRIADDKTKTQFKKLKPLLHRNENDDPDDELKGVALQVLWPSLLTTEELFSALTFPKAPHLTGAYKSFILNNLLKHTFGNDIIHALKWIANHKEISDLPPAFLSLIESILQQAWGHLNDSEILNEFAKALLNTIASNDRRVINFNKLVTYEKDPNDNRENRRKVLKAIVSLLSKNPKQTIYVFLAQPTLIYNNDVQWMIEQLKKTTLTEEKKIWSELIHSIYDKSDIDLLNAIISASEREPVLYKEFRLEPVQLNSKKAQKLKEGFRQMKQYEDTFKEDTNKGPSPVKRINKLLNDFDSGDLSAWWKLSNILVEEDKNQGNIEGIFETDLTKSTIWQDLDDSIRDRIIKAAKKYLLEQPSETEKWLGTKSFYFPEFTAYKALLLLNNKNPEFIKSLPKDIWMKWAAVTLAYPITIGTGEEDKHCEMVKMAYQNAPEKIRDTLSLLIEKENQGECSNWGIRKLEKCWDETLINLLVFKIKNENLKPDTFKQLLSKPLEWQSEEAVKYALSLLSLPIPLEEDKRKKVSIAAEMLIIYAPNAGWPVVWPIFQKDIKFGKEVISNVASNSQPKGIPLEKRLSHDQLSDLYIWLGTQFPHPEVQRRTGAFRGSLESIYMLEKIILNYLTVSGTITSCNALRKIVEAFPGIDYLERYLHDAQQVTRKNSWKPLRIKDILELAKNSNKRLVQNEMQLLDVVVESLNRLEEKLHGETPASRDIWDISGEMYKPIGENDFSDYIKRHFDDDLNKKGVIINREVQIHKGERTDLHIDAIAINYENDAYRKLTVIIEVKGCWHRQLHTAMKEQLVEQYLRNNQCKHGIYLIGWFNCDKWDKDDYRRKQVPQISRKEAQKKFDNQSADLSKEGYHIRAVVLNTSC